MFRFAELLIILFMLYLVANILRYIIVKLGALDKVGGGTWLFGLSDSWLDGQGKKKQKDTEEKK